MGSAEERAVVALVEVEEGPVSHFLQLIHQFKVLLLQVVLYKLSPGRWRDLERRCCLL